MTQPMNEYNDIMQGKRKKNPQWSVIFMFDNLITPLCFDWRSTPFFQFQYQRALYV